MDRANASMSTTRIFVEPSEVPPPITPGESNGLSSQNTQNTDITNPNHLNESRADLQGDSHSNTIKSVHSVVDVEKGADRGRYGSVVSIPKEASISSQQAIAIRLAESSTYGIALFLLTIYSIIGDSLMTFSPRSSTIIYQVIWIICFIIFIFDIILNVLAYKKTYIFSIFFPLDIISTATVIFQILPIFGAPDVFSASQLAVTRLGRIAKMVRAISSISRGIKLLRICFRNKGEEITDIGDDPNTVGTNVVSRCGKKLTDLVTRNVVLGVLILYGISQLTDYLTGLRDPPIAADFAIKLIDQFGKDPKMRNVTQVFVSDYFGGNLIYLKIYSEVITEKPHSDIQDSSVLQNSIGDSTLYIDISNAAYINAGVNICSVFALLIILVLGMHIFMKDARRLFIGPLERMIDTLVGMENNPLDSLELNVSTAEEEAAIVMKVWKKLLDSLSDQTAKAIRNAAMLKAAVDAATAVTHHLANMDLDAAEGLLKTDNPTEMEAALSTIVNNLKLFKPYIPPTLFQLKQSSATSQDQNDSLRVPGSVNDFSETSASTPNTKPDVEKNMTLADRVRRAADKGLQNRVASILQIEVRPVEGGGLLDLQAIGQEFVSTTYEVVKRFEGSLLMVGASNAVAAWNAHAPSPQHAFQACECALELVQRFNNTKLQSTVTVATGKVVVGHLGTVDFRSLVVTGEPINTHTYLQALHRQLKCKVLITQPTFEFVEAVLPVYAVDRIKFSHSGDVMAVYELRNRDRDNLAVNASTYKEAFAAFAQHRFDIAETKLVQCLRERYDPQAIRLLKMVRYYGSNNATTPLPRPYVRLDQGWQDYEVPTVGTPLPEGIVLVEDENPQSTSPELVRRKSDHQENLRKAIQYAQQNSSNYEKKDLKIVVSAADMEEEERKAEAGGEGEVPTNIVDGKSRQWKRSKTCLGKGAFGAVYLAMQEDGGLVAMKLMPLPANVPQSPTRVRGRGRPSPADMVKQAVEEVIAEVGLLSLLRHDNIVAYISSAVVGMQLAIVTEYVPGGSLHSILSQFGQIQISSAQRYTRDILRGLVYLHSNNIVHRDIKPHNVLLQIDGQCKLADFGASKQLKELTSTAKGGTAMGTPLYMAPEQAKGVISKASDVWALGICLVQLLLGRVPYEVGENFMAFQFMYQLGNGEIEPYIPSEGQDALPAHAADFAKICCRRDPESRSTAEELMLHEFVM